MEKPSVSVLLLTYNRPEEIGRNVSELMKVLSKDIEIVVVDNCSLLKASDVLEPYLDRLKVIRTSENLGVGARNIGMKSCSSDIVITLDDDVFGLTQEAIDLIAEKFWVNANLAALNFKVIDDVTEEQVNWIHHRKLSDWSDSEFETYEISEGAVALRRERFLHCGGYPEHFFISHEGPYLALTLLNAGAEIIYCPMISVRHAHAEGGRSSWRRYYYDARNVIWLSFRLLPMNLFIEKCILELGALFVYSVRDGYFRYWLKGVRDGILGINKIGIVRSPIGLQAEKRYRKMKLNNPSIFYMIKIRVFSGFRKVRI